MRRVFLLAALMLLVFGCIQTPVPEPEVKCNDSEASADVYHYGYVTYNRLTYADSCQGTSRISEYYCRGDELQSELQDCPSGYICSEGACIVVPCADSDNGNDVYKKGTAAKGESAYADYCIDNSVVEYYCANNEINSIISACASGYACSDGVCIVSACEDSESGRDASVAGTVTKNNMSYADYCSDSATVFEYYCGDGGEVASTTIACSAGYACSNGICVVSTACSDSDAGQDRYTKGTSTKGTAVYTDYCSDGDTVREYYCSGDGIYWNYLDCPSGYACSDGRCIYSGVACSDSDDGEDKYEKGTVTVDGSTYIDYCLDSDDVREYYCSDSETMAYTSMSCPSGYECSSGRCISASCSDSDGVDIYTYGHVTRDSSTYYDYCSGAQVREYWCDGSDVEVTSYACPSGYECSGGRCVSGCTDTDGGEDAYTYGTVFVGDAGYGDICADSDHVKEYYCSGGGLAWTTIGCDNGYACSSGVCVARCEETDSGNDPKNYGVTAKGTISYADTCIDRSTLTEYYCSADLIKGKTVTCGGGGCNPIGFCVD